MPAIPVIIGKGVKLYTKMETVLYSKLPNRVPFFLFMMSELRGCTTRTSSQRSLLTATRAGLTRVVMLMSLIP